MSIKNYLKNSKKTSNRISATILLLCTCIVLNAQNRNVDWLLNRLKVSEDKIIGFGKENIVHFMKFVGKEKSGIFFALFLNDSTIIELDTQINKTCTGQCISSFNYFLEVPEKVRLKRSDFFKDIKFHYTFNNEEFFL